MFKLTAVFVAIIYVAFAASASGSEDSITEKVKDQKGCYINELDSWIPIGEAKPAKNGCFEYRCRESYVINAGCPDIAALPPCYIVEDESKPYPECCPRGKCPEH